MQTKGIWGLLFHISFSPFHLNYNLLLGLHYVSVKANGQKATKPSSLKGYQQAHTCERKKGWGRGAVERQTGHQTLQVRNRHISKSESM